MGVASKTLPSIDHKKSLKHQLSVNIGVDIFGTQSRMQFFQLACITPYSPRTRREPTVCTLRNYNLTGLFNAKSKLAYCYIQPIYIQLSRQCVGARESIERG